MLIINNIHSQQILNNRKGLLREERHPIGSSFVKRFVEKMLSSYNAVYKYIAPVIHQINVFTSTIKSSVKS